MAGGGTMGEGTADDGRQHSSYAGSNTGDSGTREARKRCLLVKRIRRCMQEQEGSGGRMSIYMILVPYATPTCHTSVNHRYTKTIFYMMKTSLLLPGLLDYI